MLDEYDWTEEEKKLDELLELLLRETKKNPGVYSPDIKRQKQFYRSYEILSHIMGDNIIVSYDIYGQPIKTSGAISITGKEIKILDTKKFAQVSRMASNMEVYPRTDGSIVMAFMFYGLSKRVSTVTLDDK